MSKKFYVAAACAVVVAAAAVLIFSRTPMKKVVAKGLEFSEKQSMLMYEAVKGRNGACVNMAKDGELVTCSSADWVSGFFPGTLWHLYKYSGDQAFKDAAERMTSRLEQEQYNTSTHDIGFMIGDSYGLGWSITGNEAYKDVIVNAANSLCTRFSPTVGCIRSWNPMPSKGWDFIVIIDNMMNLELLAQASEITGQSKYIDIAKTHANTTMLNHFREDNSSYHVVNYDEATGKVISKNTAQGYSDDSSWARGQAWGLYGYTALYRETGEQKYLDQAVKIAEFIMNNPNLPKDKVPYWDYNVPVDKTTPRDVSASAITASGLLELSTLVSARKDSKSYRKFAEQIIRSLSTKHYRAKLGKNADFILMHSTINKPKDNFDTPVVYADYYYVEAMLRWLDIKNNKKK